MLQSRVVARGTIAVLAIGVFALAGLAVWGTSTTERATARVASATELGDAWSQLFERVNLEESLMHAYLGTLDEARRRSFAQTVGGAEPILASLMQMGDTRDRLQAMQAADDYRAFTAIMRNILVMGRDPDTLAAAGKRGQFAAAAVRQLVVASMANERHETLRYNKSVDRESRQLRHAVTVAFGVCLGLLVLCSVILVSYQRRVERQATRHRREAMHDSLTGLGNRVLLADRTAAAMAAAQRTGEHVGLLLIDLDGFKEVNDTLGHQAGDLLLQQVAARLTASVHEAGTVARLGGDEFAVLLPRLRSDDEATRIAHRLLHTLRQPVELDESVLEVGGSIGVAVYPTHSADAAQLMQHADIAMYTAKRGRLGVAEYEPGRGGDGPRQLTLLAELRRALASDEIILHYQPKVDIRTGEIRGVEALARWQHPRRGLVGPLDFIPLAEQSGLIEQLTVQVLAVAIEQHRTWRRDGLVLPVAVNLSTRCLLDPDLAMTVDALLRKAEMEPEMLTLEITESALLGDPVQTLATLKQIRALGVGVSIDDFGTGYSSMAYLHQMPITELKVDRSFVSQLTGEGNNKAIVRAVLDLARDLHLDVVAEGVEDERTRDELIALGCRACQGYLFSPPLPADGLTTWLAERPDRATATYSPVGR
jgi:diguanylate cyclase (GGDEF)-like protein